MASTTGIPPLSHSPIARVIGTVLGGVFAVGQRLRHPRPIHPRGVVLRGELRWIPDAESAGVTFIDNAPRNPVPVVARVSRSLGLPPPLPDIIGLAVRFETRTWSEVVPGRSDRAAVTSDIEFASTGWGVPGRFALLPHRRAERARFGILLPYRGERGAVLLGARTRSGRPGATDPRELGTADDTPWELTLGHATPFGPWHPFAVVALRLDPDQDDRGLRFDAVRHPVPGARTYAWTRAVRQPSYVRVQGDDPAARMPGEGPRPESARAPDDARRAAGAASPVD
ncbi:hypothetical protein [Microbacterium testaceum]|uniref:hypothetical protein n=1 Tax=Microbacterium testaceum TaxID=2033 RepID=UPI000B1ADB1E|nr:hypothetical protein [Microbacterium testaceum]